jgi:PAN domain.
MAGIFLSYRRDDSQGEALHLFGDLKERFGQEQVFLDVKGIEPGKDFRKAIDGAVGSCDVLLVMIGKHWLDDDKGRRRLDDPEDFVRMETAAALLRDIPVIPVLVQGAAMPPSYQLPDELEALAWRNAFEVRHARWEMDVAGLVEALQKVVTPSGIRGAVGLSGGKRSGLRSPRWLIALLLLVVGALGVLAYVLWPGDRMSKMEYDTNRLGGDYKSFQASAPDQCRDSCAGEDQCVAFTFVKAGVQGPTGVCWLKGSVPPPNPDTNCVSGIKN